MSSLLYTLVALYILWILFIANMNLERVRKSGTLTTAARILGFPVYIGGKALNIFLNFFLFSFLLLDVPRELTISERLTRLIEAGDTPRWKYAISVWICTQLLDAFDPAGKHCACQENGHDEDKESPAVL